MVAPKGTPRRLNQWQENDFWRYRFEADARRHLPDLRYKRKQPPQGAVHVWSATVTIGHGLWRRVWVEIAPRVPDWPSVFADGPTDSPHRYPDRGSTQLCLWKPGDAAEDSWRSSDGLLALFGIAAHHLFKEQWFRETGEWLGNEAPHGEQTTVGHNKGTRGRPR